MHYSKSYGWGFPTRHSEANRRFAFGCEFNGSTQHFTLTVQVEWGLHRAGNGWKIIDVVVEGISLAVTCRSEVSTVIGSHGGRVDGLLEVLRKKTALAGTHDASAWSAGTLSPVKRRSILRGRLG